MPLAGSRRAVIMLLSRRGTDHLRAREIASRWLDRRRETSIVVALAEAGWSHRGPRVVQLLRRGPRSGGLGSVLLGLAEVGDRAGQLSQAGD
jgi:hypothetical protein